MLGSSSTCEDVAAAFKDSAASLVGKSAVVTGSSAGIGEECAFQLGKLGAHVVLAVRNIEKGKACMEKMQSRCAQEGGDELKLDIVQLDTSDLVSVKSCVETLNGLDMPPLALLVCNAGIFPNKAGASAQGFELTFATNHLGHFALVQGLLPALRANKSRVVIVSSDSHHGPLGLSNSDLADLERMREALVTPRRSMGVTAATKVYGDSKLCNVLFAQELHDREPDLVVTVLHPGNMITTSLADEGSFLIRMVFKLASFFNKSVNQGTSTTMYCCLAPADDVASKYHSNCKATKPSEAATKQAGELLWELSDQLLATQTGGNSKL